MPQPTIPDALWRLPASQTAALVRAHQVSATEVARAALSRVDAVNPRLNAIVECRPDEVLARAAAPGIAADGAVAVHHALVPDAVLADPALLAPYRTGG